MVPALLQGQIESLVRQYGVEVVEEALSNINPHPIEPEGMIDHDEEDRSAYYSELVQRIHPSEY